MDFPSQLAVAQAPILSHWFSIGDLTALTASNIPGSLLAGFHNSFKPSRTSIPMAFPSALVAGTDDPILQTSFLIGLH
jgi:hypothetical protein